MAMTKTIQATVKNRTDTAANWTQKNPVLAEGEIIVVQTSAGETRLKIGDGVKTFTQLPYTDEQIYNNVVTSVNGETGDITTNSVEYTSQTLTDEQKKQARENVDAWEAYNGADPVVCEYDKFFPEGAKGTRTLYVSSGELIPPASGASTDVMDAWKYFMNVVVSAAPAAPIYAQKPVKTIGTLATAGVFGQSFLGANGNTFEVNTDPNMPDVTVRVIVNNSANKKIAVNARYALSGIEYTLAYTIPTETFDSDAYFYQTLQLRGASPSDGVLTLPQHEMSAAPTEDMQIATKKYVDDKFSDKELILSSSTAGSTKKFKLTIDDTGTLTASEITA